MIADILFMREQLPDSIRQHIVEKPDNTPINLPVAKNIVKPRKKVIRRLKVTKSVVAYTLDNSYRQEFTTHVTAAFKLGLVPSNILRSLKNKVRTCGYYDGKPLFWEYVV